MNIAAEAIRAWREDPVRFVRDCFGAEPDEWQKDALIAYRDNRRVAMKASKGVGKSCVMAWMILHFLSTNIRPKIAITSISGQNLKDGMWSEISLWLNKSEFLKSQFEVTKTRIYQRENPETWFVSARTWAKGADASQQANTLAGIHSEAIGFFCDEVSDYPDGVLAAAEAALSGGHNCKLVISGNPTRTSGPLWRACTKERSLWQVITINSDPDNPKRSPRVSIQWAKETIQKWGASSPFSLVNIFGEFPPSGTNNLFSIDDIEKAISRKLDRRVYEFVERRLGVDVAFSITGDLSVIFPRQGLCAFRPVALSGATPTELASRVIAAKMKWSADSVYFDITGGYGISSFEAMKQAGHDAIGVQFASKPILDGMGNKRSELLWNMSEWIKEASIPDIPELIEELSVIEYSHNKGKLYIMPKELIKEKIGRSPDYSDGLACTFALPDMPRQTHEDLIRAAYQNPKNRDWDPYRDA